jgi:hypothetical protein
MTAHAPLYQVPDKKRDEKYQAEYFNAGAFLNSYIEFSWLKYAVLPSTCALHINFSVQLSTAF